MAIGKISMLVVDDDEPVRSALRRTLGRASATIRWAASAEEALALIAAGVPDLLLSDYRMPGAMNGLALLSKVHLEHPRVRCVLHTGEPMDTSSQGVPFPVLYKPCPTRTLVDLIESVRASLGIVP